MHIFLNQMERTILSDTKKMNMLCLYPHEACVMCSLLPPANGCDGSETSAAGGATRQTRPKRRGEAAKTAWLHGATDVTEAKPTRRNQGNQHVGAVRQTRPQRRDNAAKPVKGTQELFIMMSDTIKRSPKSSK